eukprot:c30572_g1_i1 orf=92-349(-)
MDLSLFLLQTFLYLQNAGRPHGLSEMECHSHCLDSRNSTPKRWQDGKRSAIQRHIMIQPALLLLSLSKESIAELTDRHDLLGAAL